MTNECNAPGSLRGPLGGARLLRKTRRKSLEVIAGLAGMSKSKLDRIERGEIALDKLSDIVALAGALHIAPGDAAGNSQS